MKIKYINELTGVGYDTPEECQKSEEEAKEQQLKKEMWKKERDERKQKIVDLINQRNEIEKQITESIRAFDKEYGYFEFKPFYNIDTIFDNFPNLDFLFDKIRSRMIRF